MSENQASKVNTSSFTNKKTCICTMRCMGIYALGVLYQTKVACYILTCKIGYVEQGIKHKL